MDSKEFYDTVVAMREYQREYSRRRSSKMLRAKQKLEKEIDNEIIRVTKIVTSDDMFYNKKK